MAHPRNKIANKIATSIRLSPDARELLLLMSRKLGLSQAGILELAVRKMATSEGVTVSSGITAESVTIGGVIGQPPPLPT